MHLYETGKVGAGLGNHMICQVPPKEDRLGQQLRRSPISTLRGSQAGTEKKRARTLPPGSLLLTLPSVQTQSLLQRLWKNIY